MEEDIKEHRGRLGLVKIAIIIISAITVVLLLIFGSRFIFVRPNVSTESVEDASSEELFDKYSGVYSVTGVDVVKKEDAPSAVVEDDALKQIYLTFDDGPSDYTDDILDILAETDVKATFFVVYKEGDWARQMYQRIVDEGHTLAMHSYSHQYDVVYESRQSFITDLKTLQEYLYEVTGVWSRIYRFPGGSSGGAARARIDEYTDYLDSEGIAYFDWNISAQDAVKGYTLSEQEVFENCIRGVDRLDECVILMHDSGYRRSTVDALDDIIEYYQQRGDCRLCAITDMTEPVQHRKHSK